MMGVCYDGLGVFTLIDRFRMDYYWILLVALFVVVNGTGKVIWDRTLDTNKVFMLMLWKKLQVNQLLLWKNSYRTSFSSSYAN